MSRLNLQLLNCFGHGQRHGRDSVSMPLFILGSSRWLAALGSRLMSRLGRRTPGFPAVSGAIALRRLPSMNEKGLRCYLRRPSLAISALYRAGSVWLRYRSSPRRCPTSIMRPRWECLSLRFRRRCSVNWLIRSERMATWTSVEPVSRGCNWLADARSAVFSFVSILYVASRLRSSVDEYSTAPWARQRTDILALGMHRLSPL